jgi:hypothetical protein
MDESRKNVTVAISRTAYRRLNDHKKLRTIGLTANCEL